MLKRLEKIPALGSAEATPLGPHSQGPRSKKGKMDSLLPRSV